MSKRTSESVRVRSHRTATRTHTHVLLSIFRIYLNGGALVLAVVLFLFTGSVWSLATLVPWFVIAKFIRRMG